MRVTYQGWEELANDRFYTKHVKTETYLHFIFFKNIEVKCFVKKIMRLLKYLSIVLVCLLENFYLENNKDE